jgi:ATP-dependent DNA helicase RecG
MVRALIGMGHAKGWGAAQSERVQNCFMSAPDRPAPEPPAAAPHCALALPAATPTPPAKAADRTADKRSGPARALEKLGLRRDIDLALHLPMRYVDETRLRPITSLRDGDMAQVQGTVLECRVETRSRKQLLVRLADSSGAELTLRLLHFYPSHQKTLAQGQLVRVRGEVRAGFVGREMIHPEFRAVQADTPLPLALTPVYPSSAQLPQAYLRKAVASGLSRAALQELLPSGVVPSGLPSLQEAVTLLHHPPVQVDASTLEDHSHPAWQRLKFEELLAQQLSQLQSHAARALLHAPALVATAQGPGALFQQALGTLPFALTQAQQRVVQEIAQDLGRTQPMHRLLQGDVGSGKTVVAALAAAITIGAGWQCALMAPTEILAEQHFRKLVQWLEPLGIHTAWLTGSRKGKKRQTMVDQLATGQAQLAIGTHAVIAQDVHFARLGLAIVDEQHRFGVAQRLALRDKLQAHALEPHLLMMSATPIPRTLAMSYYADLQVSTLDELPPGRTPVVTKLFADNKRAQVIARIQQEVGQGRQVYWVCPLVDESETLDLQNATAAHAELAAALPGVNVGLLHGRMASADKAAVMQQFSSGDTKLLVATTVIEVGVDVPNASLMVIEHAERFGLAQLHQLRGRVGRGAVASVCVLLYTAPLSPTGKERLRAMAHTNDGFEIARRDLEIRGPGEFMGAKQSGDALLRFADLATDTDLLNRARAQAPLLLRDHPAAASAHVARWLDSRSEYLKA